MEKKILLKNLTEKMDKVLLNLEHDFNGLRTGRASADFLAPVLVESYGNKVPINQISTISTPDAKTITIQVWDNSLIKTVEKAIVDANLGLNPVADGQVIRLTLPSLSQERRLELVKLAYKYGENNKVSIRNVRREGTDLLKRMEKDKKISEDEHHKINDEIQKLTDKFIDKIDQASKRKEQEILTI